MTESERKMQSAVALGELADRIFGRVCAGLELHPQDALKAPLLIVGIRMARPQGHA